MAHEIRELLLSLAGDPDNAPGLEGIAEAS